MRADQKPCIYDYADIQHYLRDSAAQVAAVDYNPSLGVPGKPNGLYTFLQKLLSGRDPRSLPTRVRDQLSAMLRLSEKEREYMDLMSSYSTAGTAEEKMEQFQKMQSARPKDVGRLMPFHETGYYSKWFISAVRELACLPVYGEDSQKLADAIDPAVSAEEVEEAVDTLVSLGMLVQERDGGFRQADSILVADNAPNAVVKGFQDKMIELGRRALHVYDSKQRDVSCLTFSCSQGDLVKINDLVEQFQASLATMLSSSTDSQDRVYQLNLQIFPLAKPPA